MRLLFRATVLLILISLFLRAIPSHTAHAQEWVFVPTADAYVIRDEPDRNFNTVALYADLSPDIVAFLEFDVAGLTGPVESARLRLYVQNPTVDAPLLHTADPFAEESITWNAQPKIGPAVSDLGPAGEGLWVEYDLTGLVVGDGSYGLALVSQLKDSISVSSRSGANPPQLVVVTTDPTPTMTESPVPTESATPTPTLTVVPTETPTPTPSDVPPATDTPSDLPGSSPTIAPAGTPVATELATPVEPGEGSVVVNPDQDAYVSEARPDVTFNSTTLWVDTIGGYRLNAFLRFGITGVEGTVTSATLRLYGINTTIDGPALYVADSAWTERGLTWATQPAAAEFIAESGALGLGWIEYDVTAAITGNGAVAFVLLPQSIDALGVSSREGDHPPQLVIKYQSGVPATDIPPSETDTPVPATATPTDLPPTTTDTPLPATDTPTATHTSAPPTSTPTATAGPPTPTATASPTWTATPVPTPTASPTRTPTASPTPTRTSTAIPSTTPVSGTTVLVAAGDVACDPANTGAFNGGAGTATECHMRQTKALIDQIGPATVLMLGDAQYESGTATNFAASYNLTWGQYKGITRAVAGGSHDFYGGGDFAGYFGLAAGVPGLNWYSFDVNGWHIVVLNSYCATNGNCSAQQAWLAADLAASPSRCTMAAWHEPRYSSGYRHGSDAGIDWAWDMLVNAGAELTLVGHEHAYERFAPTGTSDNVTSAGMVEIVVGTGGKSLESAWGTILPNSVVRERGTYGVLKLDLSAGALTYTFVPEAGKSFTDSGTITCH